MTKFTLYKMQHLPTGPHFKGSLTDVQLENLLKKDKSLLKTLPDKSIYMISLTCLNKSNLVLNCLRIHFSNSKELFKKVDGLLLECNYFFLPKPKKPRRPT